MEFSFSDIEREVKEFWKEKQVYKTENESSLPVGKPKYYVLDMFPYPSGAGLHVGHPLGYIASDIIARFKRLKGFNVLHPMGFDSFGLPAEQYAIQTGQHPAITSEKNIATFKEQLDKIGFSFDWSRELKTHDPKFYKWTQWIFIQLFHSYYNKKTDKAEAIEVLIAELEKNGNANVDAVSDQQELFSADDWKDFSAKQKSDVLLNYRIAYIADSWVNWCAALGTVLANDEVKDGVSERGGYPVERKLMKQWSMRITAYADRLLEGLNRVDYSEAMKETQRNWIGRSEGCSVRFQVSGFNTEGVSPLLGRGAGGEEESQEDKYLTGNKAIGSLLRDHARANRKSSTEAVNLLWQNLRGRKLNYKFRRQHPIRDYIPDFVCLEKKLIVELDGENHKSNKQYDEDRTRILTDLGYTIIRFWNAEVVKNVSKALTIIRKELESRPDFLIPAPSPREKGADASSELFIEVFTTRPDTIFGATFITLAPEHELIEQITTPEYKQAVDDYVKYAKNRSERERMADVKKITGQFTGAYAIHPFTNEKMPVWIAEYVLAGYGTGAVMAVPAHDSRDYAFAKHFNLPIKEVVTGGNAGEPYEGDGININSDFLDGLKTEDAKRKIIDEIETRNLGKRKVNYKLRDAVFGRQRYWGEPIPIYYDAEGIPQTVDEKDLPLILPEVDKYLPTETGEPPLARAKNWVYRPHPQPLSKGEGSAFAREQVSPRGGDLEGAFPRYQTADKTIWNTLKGNARANREKPTRAEDILWQHLRNHQLGDHFRRQHAIEAFIVDFVCLKKKLIVEVDGGIHEKQIEEDTAREEELKKFGFRIIRFKNEEVISDIDQVLKRINDELQRPYPQPLSKGEGSAFAREQVSPRGGDLEGAFPLETTTMPGWAGSCWYYLRYEDPDNDKEFASQKAIDYWQNIDLYLGGDEHGTGHLIYFRFWTKFLFDRGWIPFDEPAKKLVNQGKIQGRSLYFAYAYLISNKSPHNEINRWISIIPERFEFINDGQLISIDDQKYIVGGYVSYYVPLIYADKHDRLFEEEFKKLVRSDRRFENVNLDSNVVWDGIVEGNRYLKLIPQAEKMSKRFGNVVNPDEMVEKYGADAFRMYEMFLGPLEASKPWDTNGIEGVSRFIRKFWRLFFDEAGNLMVNDEEPAEAELKILHHTIKKSQEDIEKLSFNTSVSAFMICVNELAELNCHKRKILEPLLIIISPFAPFVTEYIWGKLGNEDSINYANYPELNEKYLVENSFEYPVAVNGKTRHKINLPLDLSQQEVEEKILSISELKKYLDGKRPKKVIYVKGRMINVVV